MKSVVNITEAVLIGFKALVHIAQKDKRMNVTVLSETIGCSRHHLAKVMQRLSKTGYVKQGKRGPTGGFVLAKDPKKISFLDVYIAIEGNKPTLTYKTDVIESVILNSLTIDINSLFVKSTSKRKVSDFI